MIDSNSKALLELIKASLFGTVPCFPADTDWDAVRNEAADEAARKKRLEEGMVGDHVISAYAAKWQEPAAQSMAHYMRALFEQTNLVNLFSDNNIPLVIIKGAAAAVYYPEPQLRTMGDIDFLVNETDFNAARTLLESNDYIFKLNYEDERDYIYQKGGILFELHRRYSDLTFDIEHLLVGGINNAVTRTVNGQSFPSLPDCENGLILIDHIRHHLLGGIGLRQIIDWTMFASNVLTDEFYNDFFLPLIKSANLVTFCKVVTKMCKMYFGLPNTVTWCDDADSDTARQLLETVFESGNFGRKNPYEYRPMQSLTQSIKKEGIFKVLQNAGTENFKICKKNKFFRAFAWLFQIFRFMRKGIVALFSGQNLKNDIKAGNEKSDFYKRLGL